MLGDAGSVPAGRLGPTGRQSDCATDALAPQEAPVCECNVGVDHPDDCLALQRCGSGTRYAEILNRERQWANRRCQPHPCGTVDDVEHLGYADLKCAEAGGRTSAQRGLDACRRQFFECRSVASTKSRMSWLRREPKRANPGPRPTAVGVDRIDSCAAAGGASCSGIPINRRHGGSRGRGSSGGRPQA